MKKKEIVLTAFLSLIAVSIITAIAVLLSKPVPAATFYEPHIETQRDIIPEKTTAATSESTAATCEITYNIEEIVAQYYSEKEQKAAEKPPETASITETAKIEPESCVYYIDPETGKFCFDKIVTPDGEIISFEEYEKMKQTATS